MRGFTAAFLLACFAVSGACGLIYEVAWMRMLELLFGATAPATATVLAAYMCGLGLGAGVFGRWSDRGGDPVARYGWLELGVALCAAATPALWAWVDRVDAWAHGVWGLAGGWELGARFALAFAVLLPSTFLMGGTLPVMARWYVRDESRAGAGVGILYAVNTVGAAAGVFVSGFVALPSWGARATVLGAGALNLAIGLACALFLGGRRVASGPLDAGGLSPGEQRRWVGGLRSALLLLAPAFGGAVAMVCEIVWTRVLAVVLGSSVHAFSAMLGTFLLGIALGSGLLALVGRFVRVGAGAFVLVQVLAGLGVLVGVNAFEDLPYRFVQLYSVAGGTPWRLEAGRVLLCGLVMLAPTCCFGAALPAFVGFWGTRRGVGDRVGRVYLSNTLGGIVGALLAGFLIVPRFGLQGTLRGAGIASCVVGLWVLWLIGGRVGGRLAWSALVCVVAFGVNAAVRPWDRSVLTSGLAVTPGRAVGMTRADLVAGAHRKVNLFYREGAQAVVSVDRWRDAEFLAVNGKVDASVEDACTQAFVGHLPLALHPGAKSALVIGWGSGCTVAAVAAHPVERIDCVEIEPAVVEASRFFVRLNRGVLGDPRVRLHIGDGRNFARLGRGRYDVIVSEPSNPWVAGVANLFTAEHYRNLAARLGAGGIVCQWCQAYSLTAEDLGLIMRTFLSVFPDTRLWTGLYPDLLLVGSDGARPVDFGGVRVALGRDVVREDLIRHCGIWSPEGLFASFVLDAEDLRRFAGEGPLHTDEHPLLEFRAARSLYGETMEANRALLRAARVREFPEIVGLDPPPARNARFWSEMGRVHLVRGELVEAERALRRSAAIEPDNLGWVEVEGLLRVARGRDLGGARLLLERVRDAGVATWAARLGLGKVLCAEGAWAGGEREFRAATDLARGTVDPLRALADCVLEQGRRAEARTLYGRILQMTGGDFHASERLARIAEEGGDSAGELRAWLALIDRYPDYKPAYERAARLLELAGREEEALDLLVAHAERYPTDAKEFLELSKRSREAGREAAADRLLRRAIEIERAPRRAGVPDPPSGP